MAPLCECHPLKWFRGLELYVSISIAIHPDCEDIRCPNFGNTIASQLILVICMLCLRGPGLHVPLIGLVMWQDRLDGGLNHVTLFIGLPPLTFSWTFACEGLTTEGAMLHQWFPPEGSISWQGEGVVDIMKDYYRGNK